MAQHVENAMGPERWAPRNWSRAPGAMLASLTSVPPEAQPICFSHNCHNVPSSVAPMSLPNARAHFLSSSGPPPASSYVKAHTRESAASSFGSASLAEGGAAASGAKPPHSDESRPPAPRGPREVRGRPSFLGPSWRVRREEAAPWLPAGAAGAA